MASRKLIIPSQDEILALCEAVAGSTFTHTPEGGLPLFIKFGPEVLNEARTQQYMFDQAAAAADPHAPRIPKIHTSFGDYKGYIVMEFIEAPTVTECVRRDEANSEHLYDKVAEALKWLLTRPIPANTLGPVGGGSAQHLIFWDQVAPRPFDSAKALEDHFNRALSLAPSNRSITVNFCDEPLTFYHSDISPSNFLFDSNTDQLYMVNFRHVGIYPKSFASLPFHVAGSSFLKAIAARVNYWVTPNFSAMCQAYFLLESVCGWDVDYGSENEDDESEDEDDVQSFNSY
ncbi:hypothetical protein BDZ89DRAFT_989739 [Hymenopellis radicata]|nr:hypothetical protein BDZ89DRAFT_989739 [Hymenopellis radicata]